MGPIYWTTRALACLLLASAAYWWWRPPLYCSALHAAILMGVALIVIILGEIWRDLRKP